MKKEISEKENKRVWQFDALKLFLMFLVVLGHILETFIENNCATTNIIRLRFWIYSFHMPLFLFISGMFNKNNINKNKYSNIAFYLVLYVVAKIVMFTSSAIQLKKYNFSLFTESGAPWYCFAMFVFSLITILLKRKSKPFIFVCSIILGCIVGYDQNINDTLMLSRIFVFYPFFYAGYSIEPKIILQKLSNIKIRIISLAIIVLFTAIILFKINDIYWLSPLLSGRNPFNALGENYYLGGPIRYIYYVIVFIIMFAIISLFSQTKDKRIYKPGKNTLPVYILHYIPIRFLFFGQLNPMVWMNKILPICPTLLIFPIALVITLVLSLDFWNKPINLLKKKILETT